MSFRVSNRVWQCTCHIILHTAQCRQSRVCLIVVGENGDTMKLRFSHDGKYFSVYLDYFLRENNLASKLHVVQRYPSYVLLCTCDAGIKNHWVNLVWIYNIDLYSFRTKLCVYIITMITFSLIWIELTLKPTNDKIPLYVWKLMTN